MFCIDSLKQSSLNTFFETSKAWCSVLTDWSLVGKVLSLTAIQTMVRGEEYLSNVA